MKSKVTFIICLLFSLDSHAEGAVYIYEGKFGGVPVFRVEGENIYAGRFDYPVKYQLYFHYIVDTQTKAVLYRIEGNLIYKGRLSNEVVARVEGDYILKGRYDPTVLYRVEKK